MWGVYDIFSYLAAQPTSSDIQVTVVAPCKSESWAAPASDIRVTTCNLNRRSGRLTEAARPAARHGRPPARTAAARGSGPGSPVRSSSL